VEFESSEEINNYLLRDPEVLQYLSRRGGTPMVAMVFFDEETEEICREQGYTLILPPDSLRRRLDSKIVTTQLGNEAGAPSVPNVLGHADNYAALTALAHEAGLGDDLVVQTPYGDSGKTTFFIKSESDWDEFAADIDGQELKVMKRINNQAAAVEACITRHGTIVVHDRPDRLPRAHSVQGRMVRQRRVPRGIVRGRPDDRDQPRPPPG
jgi:hypothetical protein